jgi:hypothetical protein
VEQRYELHGTVVALRLSGKIEDTITLPRQAGTRNRKNPCESHQDGIASSLWMVFTLGIKGAFWREIKKSKTGESNEGNSISKQPVTSK